MQILTYNIWTGLSTVIWGCLIGLLAKCAFAVIDLNTEAARFKKYDLMIRTEFFQKKQSVSEMINAYNLRLNIELLQADKCNKLMADAIDSFDNNPSVAIECLLQKELDRTEMIQVNDQLDKLFYVTNGLNGLLKQDIQEYVANTEGWAYEQVGDVLDLMNTLVIDHERKLIETGRLALIDSMTVLEGLTRYLERNGIRTELPNFS